MIFNTVNYVILLRRGSSQAPAIESGMFVFDIPALSDTDYYAFPASAAPLYTAIEATHPSWVEATLLSSEDGTSYSPYVTSNERVSWGTISGVVPAPRAFWSSDSENEIRVTLQHDDGDIASITRQQQFDGGNLGLIWNPARKEGEIFSFQTASVQGNGDVILSGLMRGLRGTEYMSDQHEAGALFFKLNAANLFLKNFSFSTIGSDVFFKSLSPSQTDEVPETHRMVSRRNRPWAPSRARRDDSVSGQTTITWNRRTRVGGEWDTTATVENTPNVNGSEAYVIYVLDNAANAFDIFNRDNPTTYRASLGSVTPAYTFSDAELTGYGLIPGDTLRLVIAQVGNSGLIGFEGRHVLPRT